MSKAIRPVFVPSQNSNFVEEISIEFDWHPGFEMESVRKNIDSLHEIAKMKHNISPILEISSKSKDPLGVKLSAFNLMVKISNRMMTVESAFQGSKVFRGGIQFQDLYNASSVVAKTDKRIRNSGNIVQFNLLGEQFPIVPKTAFYDWLYITALWQNISLAEKLSQYSGFSDIVFNPGRSINCQAHSAALFVALSQRKDVELERIIKDKEYYLNEVVLQPKGGCSMTKQLKIAIDGACSRNGKSNPIGGIGILISTDTETIHLYKGLDNSRLPKFAQMTNNYAEFSALLLAILWVKKHNYNSVSVFTDSAIVVGAFSTPKWKIKEPQLLFLIGKIERTLADNRISLKVSQIPREENGIADKLSKMGISNALSGNFDVIETRIAQRRVAI